VVRPSRSARGRVRLLRHYVAEQIRTSVTRSTSRLHALRALSESSTIRGRVFRNHTVEPGRRGRQRRLVGARAGAGHAAAKPTGIRSTPTSGVAGTSADDARDLTQGFFTSLLERRDFEHLASGARTVSRIPAGVAPALSRQRCGSTAARRSAAGGMTVLPLAFDEAEGRYRIEPAESARRRRFLNAVGR
jgi:hypothetical protein